MALAGNFDAVIEATGGKPGAVDVEAIARDAVMREGLNGMDVVRIDIGAPLLALADREFLLRSLSNLIRNAIRYAGRGGPVVIAGSRQHAEVVITVSDSGPAILQEEIDRAFAPFYRIETSRNRDTGGAGLGLAIVKSCIEACNGRVECRNRHPAGFEVEIRLAASVCISGTKSARTLKVYASGPDMFTEAYDHTVAVFKGISQTDRHDRRSQGRSVEPRRLPFIARNFPSWLPVRSGRNRGFSVLYTETAHGTGTGGR